MVRKKPALGLDPRVETGFPRRSRPTNARAQSRSNGMSGRRLLVLVALFVSLCVQARAQDWPSRPVTMVVPFAPGGVYDTFGRVYAARLTEILHQPVIVENVPGAGGMTGAA